MKKTVFLSLGYDMLLLKSLLLVIHKMSLKSPYQSHLGKLEVTLWWPCALMTAVTFKVSWYLLKLKQPLV